MISFRSEFISGAINSIYHAVSWSKTHDIIAYSCSNQIYLYDPSNSKVFATLPTKAKRANSVKFLENFDETCLLVSSDSEGNLTIWESFGKVLFSENWRLKFKEKTYSGIENITILNISKDFSLILSHSINGEICLFALTAEKFEKIDSINFGNNVQETSNMMKIEENQVLLFLGGVDNKLHLYYFSINDVLEKKTNIFKYLLSLKGHENSITDIALIELEEKETHKKSALIASSSKDTYIRLWRFGKKSSESEEMQKKKQEITFVNKNNYSFSINNIKYEVNLESILNMHTEPVSSIKWGKIDGSKAFEEKNLLLMSTSFDFSLLIWVKDEKSDVWINKSRLGQMGGNKNAFFGTCFDGSYNKILAYTYHGSLYLWRKKNEDWVSIPCISGHFSRVTDLDWNSSNDYLISCSQDQSTKVFAKWVDFTDNWYEVSRAQIHGYDINSIKNLKIKSDKTQKLIDIIICGADEKIIRLFEPTAIIANLLNKISKNSLRLYFPSIEEEEKYLIKKQNNEIEYRTFTEGGAQVLGLMTKAVKPNKEKYTNYFDEDDEGVNLEENEKNESIGIHNCTQPPKEDYLTKHTLWPEINKLYGHGYEIQTITSNHEGTIIASSCKSQTFEHSSIFLWNPNNYSIIDKLSVHNYTVVQMEFSHNDEFLGSVSRDRQFVLFKKSEEDPEKPYKIYFVNKSHARIIWSLSFSHESQFCVTGSRDKKLKVWKIQEKSVELFAENSFGEGITACAFGDKLIKCNSEKNYIICVGLENGNLFFLRLKDSGENKGVIFVLGSICEFLGHSLTVNRIKFRKWEQENKYQLASCSDDHSVRILEVKLDSL